MNDITKILKRNCNRHCRLAPYDLRWNDSYNQGQIQSYKASMNLLEYSKFQF
jgi:hypothetical protein